MKIYTVIYISRLSVKSTILQEQQQKQEETQCKVWLDYYSRANRWFLGFYAALYLQNCEISHRWSSYCILKCVSIACSTFQSEQKKVEKPKISKNQNECLWKSSNLQSGLIESLKTDIIISATRPIQFRTDRVECNQ